MNKDPFISMPVAPGRDATITKPEYDLIVATFESDPDIVEQLQDFAIRWHAVNEGDDGLAFAELPECMAQIDEIIRDIASDEKAPSLTADVVMKYIAKPVEEAK